MEGGREGRVALVIQNELLKKIHRSVHYVCLQDVIINRNPPSYKSVIASAARLIIKTKSRCNGCTIKPQILCSKWHAKEHSLFKPLQFFQVRRVVDIPRVDII